MESFVEALSSSGFGLSNLPWGVFSRASQPDERRVGVALGEHVVDMRALVEAGMLNGPILSKMGNTLLNGTLNEFMSLGRPAWLEARVTLQRLLSQQEGALRDNMQLRQSAILSKESVTMHVPANIGDYTDFYTSKQHAFNCGSLFRGAGEELQPNWVHLPVGYHGRSSSIVASGTAIRRPWGQVLPAGAKLPVMAPCAMMDYELEMACFIGTGNKLGDPIPVDRASDHIFGMVLMNDWSARDIQKWEIVPLGPFNSKNFATQISPWIVTMDALEPFSCEAPTQDPEILPYMREQHRRTYDICLTADIVPAAHPKACRVTTTNFNTMYYTWPQMLAHHTLGGCNLRPGDLLASGTVSSGGVGQRGCLFEATGAGRETLELRPLAKEPQGDSSAIDQVEARRVYLEDGDEVVLAGRCQAGDNVVSFGECRGVLLPSRAHWA